MLFSYRSVTSVVTQSSLRRGCLRDDPRDGTLASSVYLNDRSLYHHLFPNREPLLSWLLAAFCKDEKWQTLMPGISLFRRKNILCVDKSDKTTTRHVAKTFILKTWRFVVDVLIWRFCDMNCFVMSVTVFYSCLRWNGRRKRVFTISLFVLLAS